jgi:flagellar hook assembly protein FlgD
VLCRFSQGLEAQTLTAIGTAVKTVKYGFARPRRGLHRVTIAAYDTRGARIATLLDEERSAGAYTAPWDGRSNASAAVSSGVYFARVEFNGEARAYKMVLLK